MRAFSAFLPRRALLQRGCRQQARPPPTSRILQSPSPSFITHEQHRSMAIYAMGEGWTGALGLENATHTIPGHHDYDEDEDTVLQPVRIYDGKVRQASVGWGSTALIDEQGQLQVIGRPQDFISLLRLNRLPNMVKHWQAQASDDTADVTPVGSFISQTIGWATGQEDWSEAQKQSRLHEWTKISIPSETAVQKVVSSAGFSAVLGDSGTIQTFGINSRGQCGIGKITNNVWEPQRMVGLTTNLKNLEEQEAPIIDVALGLQHGYALDSQSRLFSWGKASRGQLGRETSMDQDATANTVAYDVCLVSSGMHHGAYVDLQNRVYVWGKSMGDDGQDARVPVPVQGLPEAQQILEVSCGSHHTAVLLEDGSVYAFGIAADVPVPMMEALEVVEKGVLELPLRQFASHQDRTTLIDNAGEVYQVHLWQNELLREHALFTPAWVDPLLNEKLSIKSVHRGWLHTIVVTDDP